MRGHHWDVGQFCNQAGHVASICVKAAQKLAHLVSKGSAALPLWAQKECHLGVRLLLL